MSLVLPELPGELDEEQKASVRKAVSSKEPSLDAFAHMSDEWVATRVRMLMRDDLWHEPICCAARDRIVRLALKYEALLKRFEKACGRVTELESAADSQSERPAAWIRGQSQPAPDGGTEYDEEVHAGPDRPSGKGWVALYAANGNQPKKAIENDALEFFTEYFVQNYPGPETIIHDPRWHAPKVFRAAVWALTQARSDAEHKARSEVETAPAPPTSNQRTYPHGYSCWCPTCAPIHRAEERRMLIDTCRKSGGDTIERRLVDYIDELEATPPTVLSASGKCPLCAHEGPHPHTPLEQTIYRNGFKAGKGAVETAAKPARDADHCDFPDCEKHWTHVVEQLVAQCESYHTAVDMLFALLIEKTRNESPCFYPSKSGHPWTAAQAGHALIQWVRSAQKTAANPVPLVNLLCPNCQTIHIDEGEWATRLHKTHLCKNCKLEWRPFPYATVGVSNFLVPPADAGK